MELFLMGLRYPTTTAYVHEKMELTDMWFSRICWPLRTQAILIYPILKWMQWIKLANEHVNILRSGLVFALTMTAAPQAALWS